VFAAEAALAGANLDLGRGNIGRELNLDLSAMTATCEFHDRAFVSVAAGRWTAMPAMTRATPKMSFGVGRCRDLRQYNRRDDCRGGGKRRPAERVVAFYNQRGTAEQWIKEGKNAVRWTRLSCRKFRNNGVRLQLHALAYDLANSMRTLALPKEVEHWSLTTVREKLVKIGAKVVAHGRYVTFRTAEVAVPRNLFADILRRINRLRSNLAPA
jgi:hypothetical protein